MAAFRLSGIHRLGTDPKNSSIRIVEPIQSGSVCVQVASAYAYFEAPSVATKISAVRISPLFASITATVSPL